MEEKEKTITIKIPSLNIKKNFWKILSIILLVALAGSMYVNLTGKAILPLSGFSTNEIGGKVVNYINGNLLRPDIKATLTSIDDMGTYYNISIAFRDTSGNILGQDYVFVSKDGKMLFLQAFDITQTQKKQTQITTQQQTQEIPKKDRPVVELYIFSYCPAGSSALNSFAPVGKLLSSKAEMRVKFFSDMHGAHELQQNMIQECIQEVDPAKYWDYASSFVQEIFSKCADMRDINCDKNESISLMKRVGIDADKVMRCVEEKGKELYNRDISDAEKYSLRYSPSLVINNFSLGPNFDRSPEGIKNLVCSSFSNPPKECFQVLSASSSKSVGSCG
jgi:hypothetical protein